jgi:glutathione S-transferase
MTRAQFFYAPRTCALASHIALEEAGAKYEAVRLNFADHDQKKPAYLKINPKGRVPALVTDRGILTETPAILAFVAQAYPDAGLAPLDDPFAFAEMQAFNSYLCSTVHVNHAHKLRGHRWSDDLTAHESMARKVTQNMTDCFDLIEGSMFKGPWVMGDAYSVADAYLFTVALWLEGDGVDVQRFPKMLDHRQRMRERPAVQRAETAEAA